MRAALPGMIALALLATACAESEPEVPPVAPAAEALAEAITTGDFSRVKSSGDATADADAIFEGMRGLRPEVTVGTVTPYEDSATVRYETTWNLSSPWSYETEATFQFVDNQWQVMWDPAIINPDLDANTRLERTTQNATRGDILGVGGYGLAESGLARFVGLDTGAAGVDVDQTARALAEAMSVDPDELIAQAHERPGEKIMIGAARADDLPTELTEMPGVIADPMTLPLAPPNSSAQAVTGRVTTATPEQSTTSAGLIPPGSVVGASGLQASRDESLRGFGATQVYVVPRGQVPGQVDPELNKLVADYPEAPGQDVQTTIDPAIQRAVDEGLQDVDEPTSVVAIRPRTGEILAVGDSAGPARANADSLTEPFAPEAAGSPIAALALMRAGMNIGEDEVQCADTVDVGGRTITESDLSVSATDTTLQQAMAYGCVTAAAAQFGRTDAAGLADAASSLGIGVDHDLGVEADLGDVEVGTGDGDVAEALAGTGQGVLVTPLGMASMAATITSGFIIVPWLMDDTKPQPDGQPPITPAESAAMRELMEAGASGSGSGIANATGALTGFTGERAWAVGYSDDVAFAVVTRTDSASRSQVNQLASDVTRAAARAASGASDGSGSDSDGSGSDSGGSGSGDN